MLPSTVKLTLRQKMAILPQNKKLVLLKSRGIRRGCPFFVGFEPALRQTDNSAAHLNKAQLRQFLSPVPFEPDNIHCPLSA